MKNITRESIQKMLLDHVCVVEFTKVNGDLRTMPCTLKADLIPPTPVVEGKEVKEKKVNPDVMSVWCTDKAGWRSFRIENVTNITVLEDKTKNE